MHSRTTAREIVNDFKGEKLDYWVTGFGTGGTLKGVARVLAKERPDTKIVVVRAGRGADGDSSHTAQERNPDGSPAKANPAFKPHPMQGWSPDFIPKITGDALDTGAISRVITIANADAMKCQQGAGATGRHLRRHHRRRYFRRRAGSVKSAAPGSTILAMLPDTGERYLSTPLFGDIGADMNEDELNISNSTPDNRMPPKAA